MYIDYTITIVMKNSNEYHEITPEACTMPERGQPTKVQQPQASTEAPQPSSLWHLIGYFLKLGTFGFGGPVALVGHMHRELVEQRGWIGEADYQEGLALAQLAPGPLAAQLAIYLGYVHSRLRGATLVGLVFVLPSFLMVVTLGWAYTVFGGLPWMQAVFYGVGASVIGLIAHSASKLTTKTIGRDGLLWGILLVTAAFTILTQSEQVLLFLAAGVLVWLVNAPPNVRAWRIWKRRQPPLASVTPLPLATLLAVVSVTSSTLWSLFTFFTEAGAFVFGSGLAIVPFLYGGVVQQHHWLTAHQFVDAVAVAMITPGPVVITVGFIGFLVAGLAGALVAAVGTFLPCYTVVVLAAPAFRKYGKRPAIEAAVKGVTAAAIGAITGAVVVLGLRTITDVPTGVLAVGTFLLVWRVKRLPEPLIVLLAGLIGVVLTLVR
jgi:chromate transporter